MALEATIYSVEKLKKFLSFCHEVGNSEKKSPYWMKNLSKFDKVFRNNQDNFSKPLVSFVEKHRSCLEAPIIEDEDSNDRWLLIDESEEIPLQKKGWVGVKPRGILIPIKPDEDKTYEYSLPLSEIYHSCLESTTVLMQTTPETLPAKFFELFFDMLLEVEPHNVHFRQNFEKASDSVVKTTGALPGGGDLSGLISTGISAFGPQMESMLSGLMGGLDESTKASARSMMNSVLEGDMSSLMSKINPDVISEMLSQFKAPEAAQTADEEETSQLLLKDVATPEEIADQE